MQQTDGQNADAGARKVAGDTALTVAERIISQIAQFTIFVVAARILGPADFGIFALASASAILLLRVAEVGWAPFIMSQSGDDTVPRQVLLVAILAGVFVGGIGLLSAAIAQSWNISPDVTWLMILFSIWVMLANTSSAQKGVLIWQNRMKASAVCEISGEFVGLVVALLSLFAGWGILSLAFARLSYQSTHLTLSFLITRLSPKTGMTRQLMRELWVFSGQIFASRMLINIRLYTATFIIGGFLGPAAVGFFRAADRLVSAAGEVIAVPGQLLAWTLLRKARDGGPEAEQKDRINRQVAQHIKMLTAAGAPLFIWMIIMSAELIEGLLSAEWAPAAPLVAILAISRLLFLFGIVTEPLMSIVGQAKRLPTFTFIVLVVSVMLTLISVKFGVYAVAWAQVLIAAIVLLATVWLFRKHAHISWRGVMTELRGILLPLACGVVSLAVLDVATNGLGLPNLLEALAYGGIAGIIYFAAIRLFDAPFWTAVTAGFRLRAVS